MNARKLIRTLDASLLPETVGFANVRPTLCIGLDLAWFGGSAADPASQFDFLVAALISTGKCSQPECVRVRLEDRDPNATATTVALQNLIESFGGEAERIVLAIDAPLQTSFQNLPERQPRPSKGSVKRRACDRILNDRRKLIDRALDGSNGWQPNVQPGAPIPSRLKRLLQSVEKLGLKLWTAQDKNVSKLAIECFPAEAIWVARRLGGFSPELTAIDVKAYKAQSGSRLSADQVRRLVETALLGAFAEPSGIPNRWPNLVTDVLSWMLNDTAWQSNGWYLGGKMFDDVVDSTICLATAIGYATGNAHVWFDPEHAEDGHIIGPGKLLQSKLNLNADRHGAI